MHDRQHGKRHDALVYLLSTSRYATENIPQLSYPVFKLNFRSILCIVYTQFHPAQGKWLPHDICAEKSNADGWLASCHEYTYLHIRVATGVTHFHTLPTGAFEVLLPSAVCGSDVR